MSTRRGGLKGVVAALAVLGGGVTAAGPMPAGTALATLSSPPQHEPLLLTAAEFHGNPLYWGCKEPLRVWLADHCLNADDCLQLLFRDGSIEATVLERNANGKPVLLPDHSDVATTTRTVSMHSLPPLPQFGHGIALPPLPADRGDDWRAAVETLPRAEGRWTGEVDR